MQQPKIVELNMPKIAKLNIWLTIILVITFTIVYKIMYGQTNFSFLTMLVVAVLYIIFIVLHEAFHLIGFMMFGGAKFKELDYGINLKLGIAYATTVKPLTNSAMKKAFAITILDNRRFSNNSRFLYRKLCVRPYRGIVNCWCCWGFCDV